MQISRLANRIDFDLPDQEVAELLLKKCMKKPKEMYEAIYTLSNIPRPKRWALPEPEPELASWEGMIASFDIPPREELNRMVDEALEILAEQDKAKAEKKAALEARRKSSELHDGTP